MNRREMLQTAAALAGSATVKAAAQSSSGVPRLSLSSWEPVGRAVAGRTHALSSPNSISLTSPHSVHSMDVLLFVPRH
jgi:hypothetical protein